MTPIGHMTLPDALGQIAKARGISLPVFEIAGPLGTLRSTEVRELQGTEFTSTILQDRGLDKKITEAISAPPSIHTGMSSGPPKRRAAAQSSFPDKGYFSRFPDEREHIVFLGPHRSGGGKGQLMPKVSLHLGNGGLRAEESLRVLYPVDLARRCLLEMLAENKVQAVRQKVDGLEKVGVDVWIGTFGLMFLETGVYPSYIQNMRIEHKLFIVGASLSDALGPAAKETKSGSTKGRKKSPSAFLSIGRLAMAIADGSLSGRLNEADIAEHQEWMVAQGLAKPGRTTVRDHFNSAIAQVKGGKTEGEAG